MFVEDCLCRVLRQYESWNLSRSACELISVCFVILSYSNKIAKMPSMLYGSVGVCGTVCSTVKLFVCLSLYLSFSHFSSSFFFCRYVRVFE